MTRSPPARRWTSSAGPTRALLAAYVAVALSCASAPAPAIGTSRQALGAAGPATGADAPLALSFPALSGGAPHALASDRGHVVVLHAFATWCAPCMQALPRLAALERSRSAQGLRTYAVSVDEDAAQIPTFLAAARVDLPVLLDRGGFTIERTLGLRVMPTTWLLDRAGRVRGKYEGLDDEDRRLPGDVDRLLAEAP